MAKAVRLAKEVDRGTRLPAELVRMVLAYSAPWVGRLLSDLNSVIAPFFDEKVCFFGFCLDETRDEYEIFYHLSSSVDIRFQKHRDGEPATLRVERALHPSAARSGFLTVHRSTPAINLQIWDFFDQTNHQQGIVIF